MSKETKTKLEIKSCTSTTLLVTVAASFMFNVVDDISRAKIFRI